MGYTTAKTLTKSDRIYTHHEYFMQYLSKKQRIIFLPDKIVLVRISCNINFTKKFAIGRQDRKRNPAVVRSGGGGDRPYEYFMQYLSVKIGKYS